MEFSMESMENSMENFRERIRQMFMKNSIEYLMEFSGIPWISAEFHRIFHGIS
jgi:hypothetical protein